MRSHHEAHEGHEGFVYFITFELRALRDLRGEMSVSTLVAALSRGALRGERILTTCLLPLLFP